MIKKAHDPAKRTQPEGTEGNNKNRKLQDLAGRLIRNRSESTQKRIRKRIVTIFIFILLMTTGIYLWYRLKPVPVDVTYVTYQRVGPAAAPVLRLSGFITYPQISTVGAMISAPVKEITFSDGDYVKSGAVLARFDQSELQAQEKIQMISIQNLQQTLNRTERLYSAGAASDVELQSARSQMEKAQANLDLIKARLKTTVVYAPFNGLIIEKLANVGEIPKQGICRIADNSMTLVSVDVGQEDINLIKPGQPAIVTLDAYPDIEYAAKIYKIMPTANQAKNTIPILVQVLKPDNYFRPQMSAKVLFVNKQLEDNQKVRTVLVVDKSALFKLGDTSYVWRIRRGKVLEQPVKTGEQYGENIQVTEGLKPDERVVANAGKYPLKKGMRVKMNQ